MNSVNPNQLAVSRVGIKELSNGTKASVTPANTRLLGGSGTENVKLVLLVVAQVLTIGQLMLELVSKIPPLIEKFQNWYSGKGLLTNYQLKEITEFARQLPREQGDQLRRLLNLSQD